ncbi:MAG: purine-nucleoside phosphorylase [Chloroflexi bacterium]|nr:purine-nucleoside phosphorylase [Chloroflexota bacterium]
MNADVILQSPSRAEYQEATDFLRARITYHPTVGIILGSGLAGLAEEVQDPDIIPYHQIPHFPVATVEGHPGDLVIGKLEEKEVLVMRGRAHFYEGYSMQQTTFPIRVMHFLGVKTLIVTNAAGGLNYRFNAGDLMLITDHINLIGMAGLNPLRGPNDPQLGPRFPDMSQAYDPELQRLAVEVAKSKGIVLHQGIYIMLGGPSFETPADIRFLRLIGADAVGMSTVNEVTVARHMGMCVLGISGISNVINGGGKLTHEEVLEAGKQLAIRLSALIRGVLQRLD